MTHVPVCNVCINDGCGEAEQVPSDSPVVSVGHAHKRLVVEKLETEQKMHFSLCSVFVQPKRDGKDYASISSVTHMLNNTDSVLKKDDVKDAIEDYEELFAGARTEVRACICNADSALLTSFDDISNIFSACGAFPFTNLYYFDNLVLNLIYSHQYLVWTTGTAWYY